MDENNVGGQADSDNHNDYTNDEGKKHDTDFHQDGLVMKPIVDTLANDDSSPLASPSSNGELESTPDSSATPSIVESKKKDEKKPGEPEVGPTVGFFELFRFATWIEILLMVIGSIGAIAAGVAMPAISIVFGQVMNVFTYQELRKDNFSLIDEISKVSLNFVYIGIGMFVACYLEVTCWSVAGERQSVRCRKQYLKAILRQEIGWYDVTKSSELATRIASDTQLFQEAIGEKVGNFLHFTSTFISGFIVGLVNGWQLALVILAITPLLAACGAFMTKMMTELTKKGQDAYAKAGAVAEEKIGSIRTVATFSGEERENQLYANNLKDALVIGRKKGVMNGIGIGSVFFVMFGSYSLAFWYGAKLITDKTYNPVAGRDWQGSDVLTVFFAVIMGAMALGQAAPNLANFANGRGAAYKIYQVIDRKSKIGSILKGRNVSFAYPSRPEVQIFNNFSLAIKKGQTVALVGDSGGGKSSVIALLERFYDPLDGEVLMDGVNIKDINVKCLRQNIGLVSQEPTLFGVSIADNIRYGNENASMEQIIEAAKTANAHDFISALPEGYDTQVGEKGVQMSGGQKQRIAIARAMIKNPKILLLDEATSALDTQNEHLVQQAIDKLMVGRTTIVIAHRLTTIQGADVIAVVRGGAIVEKGTHSELLAMNGVYTALVQRQQSGDEDAKKKLKGKGKGTHGGVKSTDDSDKQGNSSDTTSDTEEVSNDEGSNLDSSSNNDKKKKKKKKEKKEEVKSEVPILRIAKMNQAEWPFFLLGMIGALANGAIMPVFSIIFSEILKVFNSVNMYDNAITLCLWFLLLAAVAGLANFVQICSFTYIGEVLTYHLRYFSFRSIIRQEIGWFDMPQNSTGILTANLATDATLVQGMTSQRLGLIIQNIVTMVAGLVIAFIAGWKLTLVILATVPIIGFAGKVEMDFMAGFSKEGKEAYARSGQIATEAIGGIRTVSSFTAEKKVYDKFKFALEDPIKIAKKKALTAGLVFGFTQATMFWIWALGYWYGGKLVSEGEWKAPQSDINKCVPPDYIYGVSKDHCIYIQNTIHGFGMMQRVFFAIVMSAMGVGNAAAFAPDMAKATVATNAIFKLIDKISKIDPFNKGGDTLPDIRGDIEFRNINFAYPSRPNKQIFNDFSLTIPAGKKVALVGDSGGGKSTVIGLLERFYDPSQGQILLDGVPITNMNLTWMRSNFGLVGQEPFLFSGSIIENIRYGKPDATMEEVVAAAKAANAHSFIDQLPDGYDTQLGDKYTQLSGGQKQRVAIARAIIRNPKILLLDEATSALDSKSETVVQEALDNVMKGRTSIVIAHRLSTIIDSDIIAVVKGGKVVEIGNHQQLLEMNGFYANLVQRQL
ncbi:ABC transporter B family protein [Heterostelium album PN500]|uniref:ABC transporter B family protein n=1 Tax=Heterostelium pallidum (strain ATCC 26659 / Pp 5 / PN500) TaxID=670386 RepID=D3BQN9_HETP5|nr:ABC transporter B family protein [Heterostelium album PN500]EFA76459.1 ABC transporter B family protein [Heterostelium album PN500]|eukprot:XP_020428591.1 ABC transporter B family protein [Heterostelium album PN500]